MPLATRGTALAEAAERRFGDGREHGRLALQDLRRRDRRQGHRFDLIHAGDQRRTKGEPAA
jgi:hypothetical protein